MQTAYVKVIATSKKSKIQTFRWLQEVESCASFAELETPSHRRDDLDTALAEAVVNVAKEAQGPTSRRPRGLVARVPALQAGPWPSHAH